MADGRTDRDAVVACAALLKEPGGEDVVNRAAAGDAEALKTVSVRAALIRNRRTIGAEVLQRQINRAERHARQLLRKYGRVRRYNEAKGVEDDDDGQADPAW